MKLMNARISGLIVGDRSRQLINEDHIFQEILCHISSREFGHSKDRSARDIVADICADTIFGMEEAM